MITKVVQSRKAPLVTGGLGYAVPSAVLLGAIVENVASVKGFLVPV